MLRNEGNGYVAGDIKSGAGEEGPEDLSKPRKHYAVQLALYTDLLERSSLSAGRRAFIWGINGDEVIYDFTCAQSDRNPRTLWQDYQDVLAEAQSILAKASATLPAYSGVCKLCHWYNACLRRLSEVDDLTLIPELGRSKRDAFLGKIPTIHSLAAADLSEFIEGKKTIFPGIGPVTLEKFQARAKLIALGKGAKPYLKQPISLPERGRELFFDIEVDPMRDICYLHGFVERSNGEDSTEKFVAFFADDPTDQSQKAAFSSAVRYMLDSQPCTIYYSRYEVTIYRKLLEKYPDVCTAAELESLFDHASSVDLYFGVVLKYSEWPTRDYSIKTLAQYLGFSWRDKHPSGAASIEWFHRWVENHDPVIRQRVLD